MKRFKIALIVLTGTSIAGLIWPSIYILMLALVITCAAVVLLEY